MADKYLERNAGTGLTTERLAADESTGAPDAGRIVALNADGKIDETMIPATGGLEVVAFEALSTDDLVELFDDGGTVKARLASAAAGTPRPAQAFVKETVVADDPVTVYFEGEVTKAGLTPGGRVYLSSTTPGGVTQTPVTGTGNLHQFLGRATSPTTFDFEEDDWIVLA